MSTDKRVEQLKRIAVMNLKKEGGTSRTSGNELLDSVKSQHDKIYDEQSNILIGKKMNMITNHTQNESLSEKKSGS